MRPVQDASGQEPQDERNQQETVGLSAHRFASILIALWRKGSPLEEENGRFWWQRMSLLTVFSSNAKSE